MGVDPSAVYWDGVARDWESHVDTGSWRTVADAVNARLVERWLAPVPGGSVLKTDLFDEFVGNGLTDTLTDRFGAVYGIDVSPALVELVAERRPELDVRVADVRKLPFADGAFDAVLSGSTLDHFTAAAEIEQALGELYRVLRPGGSLLITLDNGMNPVVAVRNALPARVRDATHLVPYAVGATCRGPSHMRRLLEGAGYDVLHVGAVLHCPRVLGVLVGRAVDRYGHECAHLAYARALLGFERLAKLPSRFVTGHFVAALAVRR